MLIHTLANILIPIYKCIITPKYAHLEMGELIMSQANKWFSSKFTDT